MDVGEFGLFVLRATFGCLTFAHGLSKLRDLPRFAESWGLSLPIATVVMLVQLIGGALIFLGIATQISATVNALINAVILYYLVAKSDDPFLAPGRHSWSIGVAYLGMAISVALLGGGEISIDHLLKLNQ